MRWNDFVCKEITHKNLMMQTDLQLKYPIETIETRPVPKTWNTLVFIYTGVYLNYLGMAYSETNH